MSDEVREAKAGDRDAVGLSPESGGGEAGAKLRAAATVNENQEEQITKPAPKVKPQREKDPKKVAAGKKLAEKNRQAKAALEREFKREIAEREQENENSAGWLPEMSFQTVLSLVGVAFTAFELYQRFRQKESSVSVQSPISPREESKQSDSEAGAKLRAKLEAPKRVEPTSETPRSAGFSVTSSSKIGMV